MKGGGFTEKKNKNNQKKNKKHNGGGVLLQRPRKQNYNHNIFSVKNTTIREIKCTIDFFFFL